VPAAKRPAVAARRPAAAAKRLTAAARSSLNRSPCAGCFA
jgi:hypothetical protein